MVNFEELQRNIDIELLNCLGNSKDSNLNTYFEIFEYQFGWSDPNRLNKGKRIRPLILLLSAQAVGGSWENTLPAAAAIEMMHNFSLIHDDIQDKSLLRRGKETVWVKWGEALAINAGDALLAYSLTSPARLTKNYSVEQINQVQARLASACIDLTKGQFLDIYFEGLNSVSLEMYFEMIKGKTCSLLAAAMKMGALLGGADDQTVEQFGECGLLLGQAFQVQDDWLGIWGENEIIGKSTESDLINRKKSYPILSGLTKKADFYRLWTQNNPLTSQSVPELAKALEADGVKAETEKLMNELYLATFACLEGAGCLSENVQPLKSVMQGLISRKM